MNARGKPNDRRGATWRRGGCVGKWIALGLWAPWASLGEAEAKVDD